MGGSSTGVPLYRLLELLWGVGKAGICSWRDELMTATAFMLAGAGATCGCGAAGLLTKQPL